MMVNQYKIIIYLIEVKIVMWTLTVMCHVPFFFFLSFCLFRAVPKAYVNSRLGIKLELQLSAYTTATATLTATLTVMLDP